MACACVCVFFFLQCPLFFFSLDFENGFSLDFFFTYRIYMDIILVTSRLGFWFPDLPQPPPSHRSIFPSFLAI